MNTYEILVVFKPFLDTDNPDGLIKTVDGIVQQLKGKVQQLERQGRRKLAYEIRKYKDGFLTTFLVQLPGDAVAEFRRQCQLNEDILRVTILRMEEFQLTALATAATRMRAVREREAAAAGGRGGPGGEGFDRRPGGGPGFRGDRRPGGGFGGPRPPRSFDGPRPDGPRHDGPRPDGPNQ